MNIESVNVPWNWIFLSDSFLPADTLVCPLPLSVRLATANGFTRSLQVEEKNQEGPLHQIYAIRTNTPNKYRDFFDRQMRRLTIDDKTRIRQIDKNDINNEAEWLNRRRKKHKKEKHGVVRTRSGGRDSEGSRGKELQGRGWMNKVNKNDDEMLWEERVGLDRRGRREAKKKIDVHLGIEM